MARAPAQNSDSVILEVCTVVTGHVCNHRPERRGHRGRVRDGLVKPECKVTMPSVKQEIRTYIRLEKPVGQGNTHQNNKKRS
jgi:hypothetical protein